MPVCSQAAVAAPVQCLMGTLMLQRAEQDGLCPKIRLSASTLLQAAVQMPEGKQSVRMVNREGEKTPQGSNAGTGDGWFLVGEEHGSTQQFSFQFSLGLSCTAQPSESQEPKAQPSPASIQTSDDE